MRARVGANGELGAVTAGVVDAVLAACEPGAMTCRAWPDELDTSERVVLIAVGKGSVGMARAAMERLGGRVNRGVVIGPDSVINTWEDRPGCLQVMGADHPLATRRNVEAAERALEMAQSCARDELLLTLISGGASAYLTLAGEGLGLEDIRGVTDALLRSGATITELNCVRKHLELLKGGGLAGAGAGAAAHWSLVLSDVLGDPLGVIGSGPTAADETTFGEALGVLEERGLIAAHGRVVAYLERGASGKIAETADGSEPFWERVRHRVVGNNVVAVEQAAAFLRARGYEVDETRTGVTGEACDVGAELAKRVVARRGGGPCAVLWGGETTVTVGEGDGVGGRCQELALAAACALDGAEGVGVIAFGTDGVDGPTDAAGGVVDGRTAARIGESGESAEHSLARHDSWNALGRAGALIRTGASGTNVNDVMIGVSLG